MLASMHTFEVFFLHEGHGQGPDLVAVVLGLLSRRLGQGAAHQWPVAHDHVAAGLAASHGLRLLNSSYEIRRMDCAGLAGGLRAVKLV